MTRVESNLLRRRWSFWQWPVVWFLAIVALGLGVMGFARLPHKDPFSVFDLLYLSLQLFVLNGNLTDPLNWPLNLARFLAPAVAAYTAAQAFIAIFHEQLAMLRLRFLRDHAVVCGVGRTGYMAVLGFRERGRPVVVIEEKGEGEWIGPCEELGAVVLIGDATDRAMLQYARIDHAESLIVVSGDDGDNVEIAIRAREVKNTSDASRDVLTCHVQIVDDELRGLFKAHKVFTDTGDRFKVSLFNIYESTARLLLQQFPLDRETIAPRDVRTVHLVLVGIGQMGESIVLQAAKLGHYANGKKLRITVLDQAALERRRGFYYRNPNFDQVCDISFVTMAENDPEMLDRVSEWAAEPETLPTVAICFDDDAKCLSFALALLPRFRAARVPILIRMTTDGGLTALLDNKSSRAGFGGLVHPFALIKLNSGEGTSLVSQPDELAKVIHLDSLASSASNRDALAKDAGRQWDELDEDLKEAFRHQADHVAVKLRALDGGNFPGKRDNLTADEVEVLAPMEHSRDCAGLFLTGWRFSPAPVNPGERTSPVLAAWNQVPETIREARRETVRRLPFWLRKVKLSNSPLDMR